MRGLWDGFWEKSLGGGWGQLEGVVVAQAHVGGKGWRGGRGSMRRWWLRRHMVVAKSRGGVVAP